MTDGIIQKIKEDIAALIDSGAHISPVKTSKILAKKLGLNDRLIHYTHVELRNRLGELRYKTVPFSKRMLFIPQCLRIVSECKAKTTDEGLDLEECKKCKVGSECKVAILKNMAMDGGYLKVAVAPGGSMVHKLIAKYKPKGVMGVCCYSEAEMALEKLKGTGIGVQAVLLMKDGCKDTDVNIDEVREKLFLGGFNGETLGQDK